MLKPQFLLTHKIPLVIHRTAAGSYVDGEWVPGVELSESGYGIKYGLAYGGADTVILCNIQPLKPFEIMQLPESDRTRVWYKLYTADPIRTLKEGPNGWSADEFVWKEDRYKIMKVQDWSNGMGILEHFRGYAVRVELSPN